MDSNVISQCFVCLPGFPVARAQTSSEPAPLHVLDAVALTHPSGNDMIQKPGNCYLLPCANIDRVFLCQLFRAREQHSDTGAHLQEEPLLRDVCLDAHLVDQLDTNAVLAPQHLEEGLQEAHDDIRPGEYGADSILLSIVGTPEAEGTFKLVGPQPS